MRIGFGDHFKATTDHDGYPAVKAWNSAFVEEPRWITASGCHPDLEENVRAAARELLKMADAMAKMRTEGAS